MCNPAIPVPRKDEEANPTAIIEWSARRIRIRRTGGEETEEREKERIKEQEK